MANHLELYREIDRRDRHLNEDLASVLASAAYPDRSLFIEERHDMRKSTDELVEELTRDFM